MGRTPAFDRQRADDARPPPAAERRPGRAAGPPPAPAGSGAAAAPTPTSSSPPVAVRAARCGSGSRSPSSAPEDGQRALDHQDDQRGGGDPPAEAGGERDRGEPVQGRLERQLVDAAAQAVVQRAEDGQRADAEHQGRRTKPSTNRSRSPPRAVRDAPPDRVAEALQPVLDAEQRADDPADQHRAEHDQDRGAGARPRRTGRVQDGGGAGGGDQQGDQPQTVGDDVPGAGGQPVAQEHADGRAHEHREHVEQRPGASEHRTSRPWNDLSRPIISRTGGQQA